MAWTDRALWAKSRQPSTPLQSASDCVPFELHLRRGQSPNQAAMPTPEGRQACAIVLRALIEQ